MSTQRNIELVQRYRKEYVVGKNFAVADELLPPEFSLNGEMIKLESHKQMVKAWHDTFPDLVINIQDIFSTGNRVVERTLFQGTHKGSFLGFAPTKRKVKVMGILIHSIEDGKIVEIWEVQDLFSSLEQLGIKLSMGD